MPTKMSTQTERATKENHIDHCDGIKRKLNASPIVFNCSSNLSPPDVRPKQMMTPSAFVSPGAQRATSPDADDDFDLLDMLDEEIENETKREAEAKHHASAPPAPAKRNAAHHISPATSSIANVSRDITHMSEIEESIMQESAPFSVSSPMIQNESAEVSQISETNESATVSEEGEDEAEAEQEESEEARVQREIRESEELARQLLEEESLWAYRQQQQAVQESLEATGDNDSAEAQAFRLAMELERQDAAAADMQMEGEGEESQDGIDPDEMGYEQLLQLGEQIGDVAKDMWKLDAQTHIDKLPTRVCGDDCGDEKCLICQYEFEKGDKLRTLPCKHEFHTGCVDEWLAANKCCPTCKQDIMESESK